MQALISLQILLVPTTECLLAGKDRETNSSFADLALSEDFLASHVLRISGTTNSESNNVRDNRGKAKQFNTVNGRTIVVKESFVYSNKGTAIPWRGRTILGLRFSRLQKSQSSAASQRRAILSGQP